MRKRFGVKKTVILLILLMTLLSNSVSFVYAYPYSGTSNQKSACNEMRNMAIIYWRPAMGVTIGGQSYNMNTTYRGIPYTQATNVTYQQFVNNGTDGPTYFIYSGSSGNDCSTAVALAWKTCFSSIDYAGIWTGDFLSCAQYGSNSTYHMSTVGGYAMGSGYSSTKTYCLDKGYSIISGYYASLQPGDSCFRYFTNSSGTLKKHAILVVAKETRSGVPGIVYIDQIGRGYGDNNYTTWHYEKWISYSDLYNSYYLPVYCTSVR